MKNRGKELEQQEFAKETGNKKSKTQQRWMKEEIIDGAT